MNLDTTFVRGKSLRYLGRLIMTNYKMKFIPNDSRCFQACKISEKFLSVPLGLISSCVKLSDKKEPLSGIEVSTKDGRVISFALWSPERDFVAEKMAMAIKNYAFAELIYSFAFSYKPFKDTYAGYDMKSELERMKINEASPFRIFNNNSKFTIVHTYPKEFVIPKSISDSDINIACNQWLSRRFPILSYYCSNNGASLWRSSEFLKVISLIIIDRNPT